MIGYHDVKGVIYFLRADGSDFWKVGFCNHESSVPRRILELQTGCPFKLKLVALKKHVGQSYETKVHLLMKRHRMMGEWFKFNPWMEAFMDGWRIEQ